MFWIRFLKCSHRGTFREIPPRSGTWECSDVPLQIAVDVVVAVVAGQSHQDAGSTAALLLTAQTAVTHISADRARPRLRRKCPDLTTPLPSCAAGPGGFSRCPSLHFPETLTSWSSDSTSFNTQVLNMIKSFAFAYSGNIYLWVCHPKMCKRACIHNDPHIVNTPVCFFNM